MADELRLLLAEDLDPLLWPPSRFGVDSAWYGHVPFAHWLVSNMKPGMLVELGTHNGVSYSAFCEAVARLHMPTSCFAVDTWLGDEHAGHYDEEVYEDFVRFNSAHYASFSELLRCTFDEALPYFADNSIDLLHIDGVHYYDAVKHDFESWLPKLSDRAVVLLHDTNVYGWRFGIWRLFRELKQRYPTFEFLHGSGLGVVAVGTSVPAAVDALCNLDNGTTNPIRECFAAAGEHWVRVAERVARRHQASEYTQGINVLNVDFQKERERAEAFATEARSPRSGLFNAFEAALREESAGVDRRIESLRAGLLKSKRRVIRWSQYDGAYQVWKKYREKYIERYEALEIIHDKYGVRSFFLLYPFYKIIKPFWRFKTFLVRKQNDSKNKYR